MAEAMEGIRAAQPRRFRPYPEYQDSGVEWLRDIPAHWDERRLKFVLARNDSGVWGDDPDDEGIIVLRSTEQTVNGQWNIESPARRRLSAKEGLVARLLAGDLVVTKSSGSELHIGKTTIVDDEIEELRCCFSNFMQRLRVQQPNEPRFYWYLLNSPVAREQLVYLSSTTTGLGNLNGSTLGSLRAALPEVSEQRAIASFLDRETAKIDGLVAKKERLIELLQEKRTALITRAVTQGLDPNVPMKDSGVEWLGKIPAHWEVTKLSRLTKCLDGKRIPLNAEERGRMQGEYPYWGANSIVDYVDQWLFDEELVLLGEDGAPFFDRSRPVAFRVAGKIWVNNHAHVLRPHETIDAPFLAHVLNRVDYRAFIDGSTRDKLTQGDMNCIPIQCPGVDEQRAIAAFLEGEATRIDSLVAKVREAIDCLKEFRTALISAAVTGKIDVREEAA